MFGWFRNWQKGRRMARMVSAGAIFAYWDGQAVRYGDPFRLWRDLTQDEKVNLDRLLPEVDDADGKAIDEIIGHVCNVFGVTKWDEQTQTGLTDLELLNLLGNVLRWTNIVKKNSNHGPTSRPASPAATSSTSPEPPSETTNASSGSISIEIGKTPAKPTPSSEPSETH